MYLSTLAPSSPFPPNERGRKWLASICPGGWGRYLAGEGGVQGPWKDAGGEGRPWRRRELGTFWFGSGSPSRCEQTILWLPDSAICWSSLALLPGSQRQRMRETRVRPAPPRIAFQIRVQVEPIKQTAE